MQQSFHQITRLLLVSLCLLIVPWMATAQLTQEQINDILDLHNELRGSVHPTATNMKKMVWNQDLADLAQNYAEGCNFAHNNQRHGSFGYEFVGENLGAKSIESDGDYTFLVQAWYNEVNDYTYSTHTCEPGKQCGHYTQVVWADSVEVGCGGLVCPVLNNVLPPNNNLVFLACNYGPSGNFRGVKPYLSGEVCSACPDGYTCADNLCSMDDEIATTAEPDEVSITTEEPDGVSTTTDRVSTTTDGVSTTTDGVSTTTDGVSTTTDGVSTTTDGVSTTTEEPAEVKTTTEPEPTETTEPEPVVTLSAKLSRKERKEILDLHNNLRGKVKPSASNMQRMEWDDDLAAIAQTYAEGCFFAHNSDRHTSSKEFRFVGENLAISSGPTNYAGLVRRWYKEEEDYTYRNGNCDGICGHYTQVVWADSTKLGCAALRCPTITLSNLATREDYVFLVCNYGPSGNFRGRKPYKSGPKCSSCPKDYGVCEKNLCSPGSAPTESAIVKEINEERKGVNKNIQNAKTMWSNWLKGFKFSFRSG